MNFCFLFLNIFCLVSIRNIDAVVNNSLPVVLNKTIAPIQKGVKQTSTLAAARELKTVVNEDINSSPQLHVNASRKAIELTNSRMISALRNKGCPMYNQGSYYRFQSDCPLTKFLQALDSSTSNELIDIAKKTKQTIIPADYVARRDSGLQFYSRGYSNLVQIQIENTKKIVLNDLLFIHPGGSISFLFEDNKEDDDDFFQFGARDLGGDFNEVAGRIGCNFFVQRGNDEDYAFTFKLGAVRKIRSSEFKDLIRTEHQRKRSSLSTRDQKKYILPRDLDCFTIKDEFLGYISDDGMWQFYIDGGSLDSCSYNMRTLEQAATKHGMVCSNNAFEGEIEDSIGRMMIINEAKLDIRVATEVPKYFLSSCGFYQKDKDCLFNFSELGVDIFIMPKSEFEPFLSGQVYSGSTYVDIPNYLQKGVYMRIVLDNQVLYNLGIDTRQYIRLLVDCKLEKDKITITTTPKLNATGKAISKLLPPGVLKHELEGLDGGQETFCLHNITIDKTGRIDVMMSFKKGFVVVDNKFEIENTTVVMSQSANGAVEVSGAGTEDLFRIKSEVVVKKFTSSNKWYLHGELKAFDLEGMQQMFMGVPGTKATKRGYPNPDLMTSRAKQAFAQLQISNMPLFNTTFTAIPQGNIIFVDGETEIDGEKCNFQWAYKYRKNEEALCIEKIGNASINKLLKATCYPNKVGASKDKTVGVGAISMFDKVLICSQSVSNFYGDYAYDKEKKAKGKIVEEMVRQNEPYDGGFMIYANGLDFNPDHGTENKPMRLLKKMLPQVTKDSDYILPVSYAGVLKKDSIKMKAVFENPFIFSKGCKVEGSRQDKLVHNIDINWEDPNNFIMKSIITGFLCFEQIPTQESTPVDLIISSSSILCSISPPTETGNFLSICNVKENIERKWEYTLPDPTELDYIQFASDLTIGMSGCPGITIRAREGMTKQYVYCDKKKNKFYICADPSRTFHISKVFEAFGRKGLKAGLLSNCYMNEVCFTSHQGEKDWEIKTQNLNAKRGLWMHAKGRCDLGKSSQSKKSVEVKIRLDTEITVFVVMPPIQINEKKDVNGKGTGEYSLSIVKSKTSPNEGPTMALTYGTSSFISGHIEGYGSCVVFEGDVKLKIQTTEPLNVVLYPDPETGLNRRSVEGGGVAEYFSLECSLRGRIAYEDSKCLFQIDGASLVKSTNLFYYRTLTAAKTELPKEITEVNKLPKKVEDAIDKYRSKATAARERIANLTTRLESYQNEFRKKSSLLRKKCSRDCSLVRTPGFKWDNKCQFSKSLSNNTCLKFAKDAHVAGDVHCVARCEIEQATTRDSLKTNYRDARLQVRELAQEDDLDVLIERLMKKIEGDLNKLKEFTKKLTANVPTLTTLKPYLKLLSLDSKKTDITTALKPLIMEFDLAFKGGETEKLKFICDGKLNKRIGEFFTRRHYGNVIDDVKQQCIDMEILYESIMNQYTLWQRRERDTLSDYAKTKRVIIPEESPDKVDAFYINPFVSSLFTPKDHDNHKLVENFAPWDVLKRNHPMKTHILTNKTMKNPNMVYRDACHATRSNIEHFNDMVGYMKSWTRSYTNAKKLEATMLRNIKEGLTTMKKRHAEKRSKIVGSEADITSSYYVKKLEKGFDTWGVEFSSQLNALNTMGPQLMKDNLKVMFVPAGSNTLESYFEEVSRKADVAYKKSFVANTTPFQGIAKNFVKHLTNKNTLEQLVPFVDEWDSMISKVDKRTISCHDEL